MKGTGYSSGTACRFKSVASKMHLGTPKHPHPIKVKSNWYNSAQVYNNENNKDETS